MIAKRIRNLLPQTSFVTILANHADLHLSFKNPRLIKSNHQVTFFNQKLELGFFKQGVNLQFQTIKLKVMPLHRTRRNSLILSQDQEIDYNEYFRQAIPYNQNPLLQALPDSDEQVSPDMLAFHQIHFPSILSFLEQSSVSSLQIPIKHIKRRCIDYLIRQSKKMGQLKASFDNNYFSQRTLLTLTKVQQQKMQKQSDSLQLIFKLFRQSRTNLVVQDGIRTLALIQSLIIGSIPLDITLISHQLHKLFQNVYDVTELNGDKSTPRGHLELAENFLQKQQMLQKNVLKDSKNQFFLPLKQKQQLFNIQIYHGSKEGLSIKLLVQALKSQGLPVKEVRMLGKKGQVTTDEQEKMRERLGSLGGEMYVGMQGCWIRVWL